jgi:hypothetical protein
MSEVYSKTFSTKQKGASPEVMSAALNMPADPVEFEEKFGVPMAQKAAEALVVNMQRGIRVLMEQGKHDEVQGYVDSYRVGSRGPSKGQAKLEANLQALPEEERAQAVAMLRKLGVLK